MKKFFFVFLIFCFCSVAYGERQRGDYFNRPQVGIWLGPTIPIAELADSLSSTLTGGIFVRMSTLYAPIKVGLDFSYSKFSSNTITGLSAMPLYGSVQYRLPLPTKLNVVAKAGGGASKVWIYPEEKTQWDPTLFVGTEVSFPLGKFINLGLRADYLMLYEKHLEGATYNGHIFNAGIALFINL